MCIAAMPQSVWRDTALLYVCSPGNPTGRVMRLEEWQRLSHADDLAVCQERLHQHFDGLTDVYICEHRIVTRSVREGRRFASLADASGS